MKKIKIPFHNALKMTIAEILDIRSLSSFVNSKSNVKYITVKKVLLKKI